MDRTLNKLLSIGIIFLLLVAPLTNAERPIVFIDPVSVDSSFDYNHTEIANKTIYETYGSSWGNPFDQDLNTYNNVTFYSLNVSKFELYPTDYPEETLFFVHTNASSGYAGSAFDAYPGSAGVVVAIDYGGQDQIQSGLQLQNSAGDNNSYSSSQGFLTIYDASSTSQKTLAKLISYGNGSFIDLVNPSQNRDLNLLNIYDGAGFKVFSLIGNFTGTGVNGNWLQLVDGYGNVVQSWRNASLGIGTDSPNKKLDVRGAVNISSEVFVQNGSAVSPWLYNQTEQVFVGSLLNDTIDDRAGSGDSFWNVSGSNLFPESLSYNIGIGTSSPDAVLDLESPSPAHATTFLRLGLERPWEFNQWFSGSSTALQFTSNSNKNLYIDTGDGSFGDVAIRRYDGSNITRFISKADGSAGINTPSPSSELDINGSGIVRVVVQSTDNQAGISFESDDSGPIILYSPDSSNDLRVYSSSDLVTIEDSGEVGIGTTSPSSDIGTGYKAVIKSSDQYALGLSTTESNGNLLFGLAQGNTRRAYIQYLNSSPQNYLRFTNEYGGFSFLTDDDGSETEKINIANDGNITFTASMSIRTSSGTNVYIGCSGEHYSDCPNNLAPDLIYSQRILAGQPTTTGSVMDRSFFAFAKGITTYAGSGLPTSSTDIQAGYFSLTKSDGEGGVLKSAYFNVKDISDTGTPASLQGARFESVKDGLSIGGSIYVITEYMRNLGGGATGNIFVHFYDLESTSNASNVYVNYYQSTTFSGVQGTTYYNYQPNPSWIDYNNGYLGLGITAPTRQLDVLNDARVRGRFAYDTNGGASSTFVCRDASNNLTACTSLESRKNDIVNLSSVNINNTFDKIRTIQFKYEGSDHEEYGYSADQLNEIDPKLSTFNNVPVEWENITKTRPVRVEVEGPLGERQWEERNETFTEQVITKYEKQLVGVNLFSISSLQTDELQKTKKRVADQEIIITELQGDIAGMKSALCGLGVQSYCPKISPGGATSL